MKTRKSGLTQEEKKPVTVEEAEAFLGQKVRVRVLFWGKSAEFCGVLQTVGGGLKPSLRLERESIERERESIERERESIERERELLVAVTEVPQKVAKLQGMQNVKGVRVLGNRVLYVEICKNPFICPLNRVREIVNETSA
jgi:hypothetical protein